MTDAEHIYEQWHRATKILRGLPWALQVYQCWKRACVGCRESAGWCVSGFFVLCLPEKVILPRRIGKGEQAFSQGDEVRIYLLLGYGASA